MKLDDMKKYLALISAKPIRDVAEIKKWLETRPN
jgi:hypothetical protein